MIQLKIMNHLNATVLQSLKRELIYASKLER